MISSAPPFFGVEDSKLPPALILLPNGLLVPTGEPVNPPPPRLLLLKALAVTFADLFNALVGV